MLLHSCSAAATTATQKKELKTRIHGKMAIKATRSASLKNTDERVSRACETLAGTSTTVGGYAHLGDGESRFGS